MECLIAGNWICYNAVCQTGKLLLSDFWFWDSGFARKELRSPPVKAALEEGVVLCSHCWAVAGGPHSQQGTVAFGMGGSFPACRSGSDWWAAVCPLALGETHRSYLETCSAELIFTQGRNSERSDLCLLQ